MSTVQADDDDSIGRCCTVQIKTMKGDVHVVKDVPVDSTIRELYELVDPLEATRDGKWKLMMTSPSIKTFKLADVDKRLNDDGYRIQPGRLYKVEVVLDMGACHTTCRRT
jgi:hypothetical protein